LAAAGHQLRLSLEFAFECLGRMIVAQLADIGISSPGMAGPLQGIRIVEMAGLGPGPFAAMMLADHGAEVIRVERTGMIGIPNDPLLRSRRSISLDLKQAAAREVVRRLAERCDGLIEGFRPGVMERLGLGPAELLEGNPKLVYGRVTGWGQEGPLAQEPGHDINYLALTGLLHGIGPKDRPVVPINYLGDYAGGGLMLAFAMVSALLHVRSGGDGQVIDAAMTDGAALVGAFTYGLRAAGRWTDQRESNLLDGGDPAYRVYRCADGKFLAVGTIEPQFRRAFFECLGLPESASADEVQAVVATCSRDEWVRHFAGKDACVAPVLDLSEAPAHPHNVARGTFIELDGVIEPRPAPRYSATANDSPRPPRSEGEDAEAILSELGYSAVEVAEMREQGALL
jgi:alpha-methylacyl-CoA racemase